MIFGTDAYRLSTWEAIVLRNNRRRYCEDIVAENFGKIVVIWKKFFMFLYFFIHRQKFVKPKSKR